MRSLCSRPTCSLKQQSAGRHVAPLGYIILITNQPGLEYMIYRTRGEHANHYATNAIKCLLKYNRISRNRTHIQHENILSQIWKTKYITETKYNIEIKKYHTVGTGPQSNRKIVERCIFDISTIHDTWLLTFLTWYRHNNSWHMLIITMW
jgi:hypothetical protein